MLSFKEFLEEQQNIEEGIGSLLLKHGGKAIKAVKDGIQTGVTLARRFAGAERKPIAPISRERLIGAKGDQALDVYARNGGSTPTNTALVHRAQGVGLQGLKQRIFHPGSLPDKKALLSQVRNLDKSLKGHTLKRDTELYHGTATDPRHLSKVPTYLSTTNSPEYALSRAIGKIKDVSDPQHLIKIHAPAGTKARDLGQSSVDFLRSAAEKGRNEFLLPRGTRLEVGNAPTKIKNGVHHWDARIVSQGERIPRAPVSTSVKRVVVDASKSPRVQAVVAGAGATGGAVGAVQKNNR